MDGNKEGSLRDRLREWSANKGKGTTFQPRSLDEPTVRDFTSAKYTGPERRTRESLRNYIMSLNTLRFRRMVKDLAWMERELERIGMNPKDARFLL